MAGYINISKTLDLIRLNKNIPFSFILFRRAADERFTAVEEKYAHRIYYIVKLISL